MAGSRRIVVEFLGKDTSAGKTASAVEQKFGKLGGRLDQVGRAAGRFLVGGVVAGGAAMVKFGGQASDLAETQSKVAQIFGEDSVDALDKFSASAARTMGQSKQTALDAAATFGIIGKSAGKSGEDLVDFSTEMATLAGDMASFNNTTPEEAIEAIGAAMRGEAEPIRKYGVLLDDATLRNEALKLGLIKSTKDALTPQNKALAAQAAILSQTKDQQGDFARTSDGLANKQRILKAELENMSTALGAKALPFMIKAVEIGGAMSDWASEHKTLVATLAAVIGTLAAGLYTASLAMRAVNIAMAMNPVGLVVLAIAALAAGLVVAYKKSETFRDIVNGVWDVMKSVGSFIADVFVGYLKILSTGWLTMGIVAIGALKALLSAAFTVFGGILSAASKGMGWIPGIGGKIKAAKAAFTDFGDATIDKLDAVSGKLKSARDKVNDLGNAKGKPQIDGSSIDALIVKLDRALARMRSLGANLTATAASGGPWSGRTGPGKASGGRVWAGTTYPVGERGMELFTPETNGYITPAHKVGEGGGSSDVAVAAPLVLQLDSKTVWQGLLKMKRTGGIVELGLA